MNKILIIEDDKILLEMYKDEFVSEHFEVLTANEGQEGIDKMKANKPDAILLDIIMPKVNGYEFLKLVKGDPNLSKTPILVLTNVYTNADDLIKNWNVATVLMKSDNTPGNIVTKVKQFMGQKNPASSS